MLGATHVDAVRALRTAGDNLSLIVCDGYDEAEAMELNQENVLYNPSLVEPMRFSPDSQSSATSGDSILVSAFKLHVVSMLLIFTCTCIFILLFCLSV